MPIPIVCPGCGVQLKAPDAAAGKRVKCPKCANPIPVPALEAEDPGFDIVDDTPAPAPAKPVMARAKPVAAKPVDDDEEDDRPRTKRKSRDDDEEEEDRPRRSASRKRCDEDDDDEDDRPRNRGRGTPAKKSGGFPIWIPIAGGALLLIAIVVGAVMMFGGGGGNNGGGGSGGFFGGGGPPAGFTEINEAGITVYMHGMVKGQFVRNGGPDGPPNPNMYSANDNEGPFGSFDHSCSLYATRTPGFSPGPAGKVSAQDAYESVRFIDKFQKHEIVSSEEITVGGQPALKLLVKELPDIWGKNDADKEFFKDKNNDERARVAKEGKKSAVIYVVNGEWKYVLTMTNKLNDIDPGKLKTMIDSIKFTNK